MDWGNRRDLKLAKITRKGIENKGIFRSNIYKWQGDQEEYLKKKTRTNGLKR